jgi:glutamate-1-semialdehyde aminotransferase/acyl carrier protein
MNCKSRFHGQLCEIFQDLSGVDVSTAANSSSFLDLGFDSLFLTQVTQALQTKFHVKVTFRQLMSDLSSLDALAQYLEEKLPAVKTEKTEPPAAPAPQVLATVTPAAPIATPTPAKVVAKPLAKGSSVIEQVMRDQLQAMNELFAQQLAALTGIQPATAARTEALPTAAAVPIGTTDKPAESVAPAQKEGEVKELKGYSPFKPLTAKISGELTANQDKYIRDLQERYSRRTPRSKEMTQRYRSVLADPRVVAGFKTQWKEMVYPIITDRSKGSHLWDIDGNDYVDILNGFGPIMLGHRPDFVEKAIAHQLQQGFEIGPQTLLAGEVAELICEMTSNERASFCNTGSEAVTAAIRVARTVTGRNRVVIFAGDYHGMFDEVLVKGIKKKGEPSSLPSAPGIPREKAANITVLDYGTDESLEWIRKNANELAAVIVEPVQSRHPNLQPVAFLKELRKITEASDTCFVFDEVVTGFRVHPGGCQALFGIRADLATYGKVLAGGMPIGVLAGKAKYMDALDGGMWQFGDDSFPEVGVTFMAGTFVRHPLAMAASKAVLLYLKEKGAALQNTLNERSAALARRLNALFEQNQVPTRIENFASIFYFGFPADFRFGSLFYYSLRLKGIHVL